MRAAKLHGAGNDFLLFDGHDASLQERLPGVVARLCHRRLGIGADGVLLVVPYGSTEARVLYWNSDGSPAAFCANGTRCAARFAARRWGWESMVLHTPFAPVPARAAAKEVELGLPAPLEVGAWHDLEVGSETVRGRRLVLGVPHLVVPVDWADFWIRPLDPLAPGLRAHPDLPPGGANVTFVRSQVGVLEARSFERGIEAETLSCGSGDVAAALVAVAEGWLPPPVEVRTASGRTLRVAPDGKAPACSSRLTGPAEWVADLEIAAELLA
ncbi:MAG: diaminopimelate epimerase [Thermoanaerobaculaceae bacterium]|nr:diaminopimelate epimerase [Thermoanaerobaculaceae bacterium]MDI9620644.1 diaminopimelate epimerase [Acidobacteriota bacterium]NLH10253.1 diaminopimelate epimerase [Holophagae bacterium]HPW55288.1 diaminopimelate epimerase [Thermoanaerobaculaceae bacterium]